MEFIKTNGKADGGEIGLSLLGSISAFSIWSAVNPSFFTIKAFMKEEQVSNVRFGMNVGMALIAMLSVALLLAYGKKGKIPAIITGVTGVGLWFSYDRMVKKSLKGEYAKTNGN